jgi:hypothetical protein
LLKSSQPQAIRDSAPSLFGIPQTQKVNLDECEFEPKIITLPARLDVQTITCPYDYDHKQASASRLAPNAI